MGTSNERLDIVKKEEEEVRRNISKKSACKLSENVKLPFDKIQISHPNAIIFLLEDTHFHHSSRFYWSYNGIT